MSQIESEIFEDPDSNRIVIHEYDQDYLSPYMLIEKRFSYTRVQYAPFVLIADYRDTKPPYRYHWWKDRYGSSEEMLKSSPIMRYFSELCPDTKFYNKPDGGQDYMTIMSDLDLIIARMLL